MQLRRRALVALQRESAFEESVVWSAAAAEFLLDEVLRMISWERQKTPESAAVMFKNRTIAGRVKASYSAISDGDWGLDKPGRIRDWLTKVAQVRNQVVHGNRAVTKGEAELAIASIDALLSYVGDCLCAHFEKFWRTAYFLLGSSGLDRRAKLEEYEIRRAAVWEPDWAHSSANWRNTCTHVVEGFYQARVPVPRIEGDLILVWGRRNRGFWVHEDGRTELASRAEVDESTISGRHLSDILELLDAPDLVDDNRALSVQFEGVKAIKLRTPWRESYHFLPLRGVMVDGSDIADKQFTWRPDGR